MPYTLYQTHYGASVWLQVKPTLLSAGRGYLRGKGLCRTEIARRTKTCRMEEMKEDSPGKVTAEPVVLQTAVRRTAVHTQGGQIEAPCWEGLRSVRTKGEYKCVFLCVNAIPNLFLERMCLPDCTLYIGLKVKHV